MRFEVIDSPEAFKGLQASWDAVYDADPEAHFFLSWTWMSNWLDRVNYPSLVLAARPEGESSDYAAFFPIWIKTKERKTGDLYNVIHMGGNHFADYTGFICRPEQQEAAIAALADGFKQLNWRQLHLQDIRTSDQRVALLLKALRRKDFNVEEQATEIQDGIDLGICPVAKLPADWDEYLDSKLSANTRQKIRRLLRQVESSKDLRIVPADKDSIERDIETLLKFWTKRWGDQKGTRLAGILENNRVMLRHVFDAGSLFLPVLWQGDRPVGALAILADSKKKTFLFFAGGRDQTFKGPPPGVVLHAYAIRHAIQDGITDYEFLRGNESYKYSFGVEEHRIKTIVVSTKNKKNIGDRLDKHCVSVAIRRALQHQRAGDKDKAEIGYGLVLEVEPGSVAALYGLGRIAAKRGNHEAAMDRYKALLSASPEGYQSSFVLGATLQAQGKLAEAADAYSQGIEREPKSADAYYDLGRILRKLGLYDLAIAAYDVVVELEPEFTDINLMKLKAVKARDRRSPEERARVASENAAMCDRIVKLKAIAKAAGHYKPKTDVPLVLEWQQKGPERPFSFSRNATPTAGVKLPPKG